MATANTTPHTATCLNCGDTYATASGKCTRCGKLCIGGSTLLSHDHERYGPQPGAAIAGPPAASSRPTAPPTTNPPQRQAPAGAPQKVTLPYSRSSLAWMDHTSALIAGFTREMEAIDQQLAALNTRRAELALAIRALQSIPQQVQIAEPTEAMRKVGMRPIAPSSGRLAPDRWSKNFDCCQGCGTNKKDPPQNLHASKGLCRSCDGRRRAGKPLVQQVSAA
jgi:hypothetical protein